MIQEGSMHRLQTFFTHL